MDLFQASALVVGVFGGVIAASKVVVEMRKATEQRRADQRWKQAEMAKSCIDELVGRHLARCAMRMLDWSGRSYEYEGKRTGPITWAVMLHALRVSGTAFEPGSDEQFVRGSFDEWLDGLERLEHFIRIDLIRFEDVESAFSYYIAQMAASPVREVIDAFLDEYEFALASAFVKRFSCWLTPYQSSKSVAAAN